MTVREGVASVGRRRSRLTRDGTDRPGFVIADSESRGNHGRVKRRRVVILAYPGLQPLDVAGPADVFSAAARFGPGAYSVEVVAAELGPILAPGGGYAIAPTTTTADCSGRIDTLMVAGGLGVDRWVKDESLVRWVRAAAGRSRRIASVCSGAFLLAAAGLLEGRRATTHWDACGQLARSFPEVDVDPKPIFVRDGNVWTSAGVTAGIDLSLALVEDDLGADVAREIARWLVVFLQRPGGQAQFSSHLAHGPASREPLRELQAWMADNLDEDLRVESLAARAAMSPRNFARAFHREIGLTPASYVEALRVEAARQRLEVGPEPVDVVAARVGFGTPETMRRAFARRIGVPPSEYRARFSVVDRRRLLEVSMRIGVGPSLAFLRKQRGLRSLLGRSRVTPDRVYDALLPGLEDRPGLNVTGFHYYTFNQLVDTWKWERQKRAPVLLDQAITTWMPDAWRICCIPSGRAGEAPGSHAREPVAADG